MTIRMLVENDNGNSTHKIRINGKAYCYPNVNAMAHGNPDRKGGDISALVAGLHDRIDVQIDSPVVGSQRYLIGNLALETQKTEDIYTMDVGRNLKYKEALPVINTLGILATVAVQEHFEEKNKLVDREVVQVEVDMVTALPASMHTAAIEKEFVDKFLNHVHEVKVFLADLAINVQIRFTSVEVLTEGVPAMFAVIEDGENNYRDGEIFDEFKKEYAAIIKEEEEIEEIDGSYFLSKKMLHLDVGEGSTEVIFTAGYTADPYKSEGERYGIGQAVEKALYIWEKDKGERIVSRQEFSKYLKGQGKKWQVQLAKECLSSAAEEVIKRLYNTVSRKLENLNYDVDVLCVYGGASILLKDSLYPLLKELCDKKEIKLLYIPSSYAVEMNMVGMGIYHEIMLQEEHEAESVVSEVAATEE